MALLLVAGAAEGVGVLTLLPLLEVAVEGSPAGGGAEGTILAALAWLGVAPTLGALLAVVVGAVVLKGGLRWIALRRVAATVATVAGDLRRDLFRALAGARGRHLDGQRAGDLATAVGRDAFWGSYAYQHACAAVAAAVEVGVYAAVLVLVSWRLGAAALAAAALLAVPLGLFVRESRRAGVGQTEGARSLASSLLDGVAGLKAIRSMGREEAWLPVLERETVALESAERRQVAAAEGLRALQEPLVILLLAPVVYGALAVGGVPVAPLLVGIFLFHRLVGRTHRLQAEYQAMAAAEAAFTAVRRQTLEAEGERECWPGRRPPPALSREIAVRGVDLVRGGRLVLADVSFEIPAGRLTTVIGPSGAGKTTLVDLLVGLYRPERGAVEVDGVPLDALDMAAWRRRVGYVPQESVLLHDTVARNLTLGDDRVPPERIERALSRAGAREFVAALPRGLDTVVGERGARLSGGERQRLAVARALLHEPVLLVLDEATSGLDAVAEAAFCRMLRGLLGATTVVATSHRPRLAEAADRVLEIRAGRVTGSRSSPFPPLSPAAVPAGSEGSAASAVSEGSAASAASAVSSASAV